MDMECLNDTPPLPLPLHFPSFHQASTCRNLHCYASCDAIKCLNNDKKTQQFLKKELSTQRKLEPRSRAQDPTKVSYGSQSSDVMISTPPPQLPPKQKILDKIEHSWTSANMPQNNDYLTISLIADIEIAVLQRSMLSLLTHF